MAFRWGIAPELAFRLLDMSRRTGFAISIFSGYRDPETQQKLDTPTKAPVHLSTHTTCPATGADVQPDVARTKYVKAQMGRAAIEAGLRWGGGAPVDSEGIPVHPEWMHFDLGPRRP